MQQFAIFIISLSIAIIFAAFSIVNGFENQIQSKILKSVPPILITAKIKEKEGYIKSVRDFNNGFEKQDFSHHDIKNIHHIRNSYTFFVIDENDGKESFKLSVEEVPEQEERIMLNNNLQWKLQKNRAESFIIMNPNSYDSKEGKFNQYKMFSNINKIKTFSDDSSHFRVKLSSKEYQKVIGSDNYTKIEIEPTDINNMTELKSYLEMKIKNSGLEIKTWDESQPQLINALKLQRKIFWLLYFIMFILLTAIIISTNIAFFKEKRKDWALFHILDVIPNSSIKIFAYKNILTFLITAFFGFTIGVLISIYSNEILYILFNIIRTKVDKDFMFGTDKISYVFSLKDAFMILGFSFTIFLTNFFLLTFLLKKENISNTIRGC